MAHVFKMQLALKRQPDGEPVKFKVDGGRFQCERTLKLNVNAKYSLELTFKPAQTLQRLNVQGSNVTSEERHRDHSSAEYFTEWVTSGVDMDKPGKRHMIPILIELKDVGTVKINLQIKFYMEAEKTHSQWGDAVHFIEYECKRPENSTYVDIIKETYR